MITTEKILNFNLLRMIIIFELLKSNGTVNATCGSVFYTKLDLGIVKYHFEIASEREISE